MHVKCADQRRRCRILLCGSQAENQIGLQPDGTATLMESMGGVDWNSDYESRTLPAVRMVVGMMHDKYRSYDSEGNGTSEIVATIPFQTPPLSGIPYTY